MQKSARLPRLGKRIQRRKTSWYRAGKDTDKFRQESKLWFWGMEVVGAAVFGVVGSIVGSVLVPDRATQFQQNAYSPIGGGAGVVIGFAIAFAGIFIWNLFRAPYRQRDEARQQYRECRQAALANKERSKSDNILLIYDDVFYPVCRERLKGKDEVHRIGVSNSSNKTVYSVEVRLLGHSTFQPVPSELPLRPAHTGADSPCTFDVNPSSDWHLDRCVDFLIWRQKEKTIEFCFASEQGAVNAYKLVRGRKYSVTLGVSAKDVSIDKEWSAILSSGKHGLDIDLSEIEVLAL